MGHGRLAVFVERLRFRLEAKKDRYVKALCSLDDFGNIFEQVFFFMHQVGKFALHIYNQQHFTGCK